MAVIYKISCLDESVKACYIGSTNTFKRRMIQHKHSCNNENGIHYNVPLYQFIRENQGWGAWKMTIIDSLTTRDKNEILKCERRYVEEQEFSLNKLIPSRTKKQHHQDHKEKLNEISRQYYQDHKEKMKEKQRLYNLDNKEKIAVYDKQRYQANREKKLDKQKQYNHDHKEAIAERNKQYRLEHKEEIAEKGKEYREANRETIRKYYNEKIQCEKCGAFSTRANLARHQRTMRCINYTTK